MGLDISAISKIQRVEGEGSIWIGEDEHSRHSYESGHYEETQDSQSFHERVGSYSIYNRWRNDLAMAIHGVSAETIWQDPTGFEGKAFVELIDFSDCDGVIGAEVAEKLYHDFVEHEKAFKSWTMQQWLKAGNMEDEVDLWWDEIYDAFMQALDIARNEGVLIFG